MYETEEWGRNERDIEKKERYIERRREREKR